VPLTIDASLIEAAASDDRSLEQLIIAVWPEAFRLAAGILRDRSLAEDAAQEACASMAVALSSLKNPAGFRTWFYRLVVNEAMTISRRRREAATLHEAASHSIEFDNDQAMDLFKALHDLPAERRAIVLLHYYAGLTSREIAVAAHLPAPTVRFHLMLARRALRRALSVAVHPASSEALTHVR
jgi:RNA polymerase sigma-70 factor, ECF subfamily